MDTKNISVLDKLKGFIGKNIDEEEKIIEEEELPDTEINIIGDTFILNPGNFLSIHVGEGLEFERYSVYDLGEDTRRIDPWATMRSGGKTIKKDYIKEKALQILFLTDITYSMFFGSGKKTKLELAAFLCRYIGRLGIKQTASLGLYTIPNDLSINIPPKCRPNYQEIIYNQLKNIKNGYKKANPDSLIGELPRERSLVYLMSDFQEEIKDWEALMIYIKTYHDLVPIIIKDRREEDIPPLNTILSIIDMETSKTKTVQFNEQTRNLFIEDMGKRKKTLDEMFNRHNTQYFELTEEIGYLSLIEELRRRK